MDGTFGVLQRSRHRRRPGASGLGWPVSKTAALQSAVIIAVVSAVAAASSPAPRAVSPGTEHGVRIGDRCPTFSWSALEGASSYELVVYELDDLGVVPTPVLTERIPGAALSFTPPLERCLARAARYAWTVRAAGAGGRSQWAAPILFTVAAEPSDNELAAALEIVRRHLAAGDGGVVEDAESVEPGLGSADGADAEDGVGARAVLPAGGHVSAKALARVGDGSGRTLTPDGSLLVRQTSPGSLDDLGAKVTVVGEVRTVDAAGEPRLWGQGRPGTDVYPKPLVPGTHYCFNAATSVTYGLSKMIAEWGAAASACPAGTWVCKSSDIVACNTTRPDTSDDYLACDGTGVGGFDEDEHPGWLAEAGDVIPSFGAVMQEDGVLTNGAACFLLPVWCCWE